MRIQKVAGVAVLAVSCALFVFAPIVLTPMAQAQSKPKLTLDEFFNSVSFPTIALSPDGTTVYLASGAPPNDAPPPGTVPSNPNENQNQ